MQIKIYSFVIISCHMVLAYTRLSFYKKHDFKKHEAEITGPVDC